MAARHDSGASRPADARRLVDRWRDWGDRPLGSGRLTLGGERAWWLALFAALVMLRLPQAWVHGRFLDEEGTIFFAYAWHRPALAALFRSFGGYLNLAANAATLAAASAVKAGILPIERAPYLTMTLALAAALLPASLLVTGRAAWLGDRRRVLIALLVVAIAPRTEEVFLDVLHIQFHLALCTALILALDLPPSRAGRAGCALLLFVAPLCGPAAIVILPLFLLRALADRSGGRLAQAAALGAGAAIQLALFFAASPARGHLLDPVTLAAIFFVRFMVMPFATPPLALWLGRAIGRSAAEGGIGPWPAALAATMWFGVLVLLSLRRRSGAAFWLLASGLGIAAASFGGGMIATDLFGVYAGERYNFLPLVLLTWSLLALSVGAGRRGRAACLTLCGLTLVSGAIAYPAPLAELARGPSWPAEVARWRRDHRYAPATWPASWRVDLSDGDRPCSPPRSGAGADPTYCEASWLARVTEPVPRAPQTAGDGRAK